MSKVKKYVVVKYNYEYNDNWYEHDDNISETEIKIFDDKDVAEAYKKELSKEAINDYPTDGNLANIQDNINLSKVRDFVNSESDGDDDDDYEVNINEEFLKGEKWDKLYSIISDAFYKIVDVEVDVDTPSITLDWKSSYSKKTIIGIVEDDNLILHSATEPALVEKDDYEVYKTYYLKGQKYEKVAEWKSESRKYKIGNLLSENEKEE
jgi:hypothetical protein